MLNFSVSANKGKQRKICGECSDNVTFRSV
nr:MAG TPA: zinc-finger associated domain protein [Caudoviricetes sp.]